MTRFNSPFKAVAAMSVFALTAITAPSAFASDGAYSKISNRAVAEVLNQRQDRSNRLVRSDSREDRGNRNADRSTRRGEGSDRGRNRNTHTRDRNRNRHYNSQRSNRNYGRHDTRQRHRAAINHRNTSFGNYRRGNGYRHNGFRSNYRSNTGISFSFGNTGFSSYRWSPSNYGLYRPGRISFANYRNQTRCDRIIVDGFHYGTLRPVSVTQCFNPWDGYYIIQGSERIAYNHW